MKNSDEQGLVEAAQRGDHKAFETLVLQYQKPIYNVAYRMLHDPEDTRDVTQTVFLKAFEKLHQYDPERKFFSWLCRIAINEAINHQSRRKHEVELPEREEPAARDPGDDAQREELNRGIAVALMKLDNDHRGVVVLKHIAGMSYQDISATLDVSEKTVKARLYSARQKLRSRLKRDAYL
jgi:RNA polymerase sigma-70 factor (ECF subfamily)